MALPASPFPNGCVAGVHAVGWTLILPCFWFLDRLIAVCKSTTVERTQRLEEECYLHPLKLLLGQNQKRKKVVGFFNCTHLHAPEGEGEIRCQQLNMVAKWIGDFQSVHRQQDEEVAFDVLCGDFNFDNCSPDDTLEQNHGLFNEYRDPCRAGPGKEKPWVIGTLLEQPTLYEEDINTPEGLQRTLESEDLRKQYVCPPVPAAGLPLVYPENGQPWIGRRIDYILYRESSISTQCRTDVEEMTFITHLAGLTDHIPVGLRLNIVMNSS